MKIVLDGPIGRRGAPTIRQRLGRRATLLELADDEAPAERAAKLAEAEVLIGMRFDKTLPPTPRLRLLQLAVSGLDLVDLSAVPAGVAVCNVYEHGTSISEYVLAAMLHWTLELARRDAAFKAGSWSEGPHMGGPMRGELAGKTVGLVGYGNIGRAVAERARAFGMRIEALTRTPRPIVPRADWLGGYGDLMRLLANADFLVIACPLDVATRGLIDAKAFAAMKPEAVLINIARGPIVAEDALYAALAERRIAGAVLDVWYQYVERDKPDIRPSRHPFHALTNVVMTPHIGGWTEGQQSRRWAKIVENLQRWLDGKELLNQVHPLPRAAP